MFVTLMLPSGFVAPTAVRPRLSSIPMAMMVTDPEATRDPEPSVYAAAMDGMDGWEGAWVDGRLAEVQATQAAKFVAATGMYDGDKMDNFDPLVATVTNFISEEPKLDSSMLGVEESRKLAQRSEGSGGGRPKSEVAWCSALTVVKEDFSLKTLTAWNNPTLFVPHFYSAVGRADGGSLSLCIDFRPRAEAGYDTALEDGSFPEPTSREMFALGSMRKQLAELYFTEEAASWAARLRALDGAQPAPTPSVPPECAGPLLVDIRLPLTDDNVEVVAQAVSEAADLWVAWMGAAEKLDGMKTMQVFAHDAKVRAMTYAYSTMMFEGRLGPNGAELAAADAGPLDIVDRSTAQNNAASSAFGDDDEKDLSATDMQRLQETGKSLYDESVQNY